MRNRNQLLGSLLAMLLPSTSALCAETLVTPAIGGVVAAGVPIELVRDGFNGTEGPIPYGNDELLFTENRADRILRIAADGSISVFLEGVNGSNALTLNPRGELVAAQTTHPAIGVIFPAAAAKTLVEGFEGTPFNRPNDITASRRGTIYFTDPGVTAASGEPAKPTAVYAFSSDGKLARFATDIKRPNGIALSPDERTLYVADTAGEWVLAFAVARDGTVGERREFARVGKSADGLAVDAAGRLYVATKEGVQIFDARGKPLGVIALPLAPQNLAFAGRQKRVLYVVGRGAVWRIPTRTRGVPNRAK